MTPDNKDKKTEVLYGVENAVGRGISFMKNVVDHMDITFDSRGPSIVVEVEVYTQGYIDIRKRGGKIRALTDINTDNVRYCKELLKLVDELRHLDGVKGGIAVNGKEYMATTVLEEASPLTQVIYSNDDAMVRQGQYIFDTFWNIATPAQDRIKNIEDGTIPEFIRTIVDPAEIQKLGLDLANSAKEEILVLFSTANAFHRQEQAGGIKYIQELAAKGIRVRILTPIDDKITIEDKSNGESTIEIRNIEPNYQTKVSILIVDRKYCLSVELKDDSRKTSVEAIGLASYSNSRATVSSYASIFDSLWNQTELYEKLKAHDEMQREFINTAAHELRTPVQPIIGLAGILYQKEKNPENRKLIEVIDRNALRLHRLTDNLLDVARIEGQSLPLSKEIMNATNLIKDAVDEAQKTISNDKISMAFSSLNDNLFVNADKIKIHQVIHNLLNNAAKFTQEGNISVKLERDHELSDEFLTVSVRDVGAGIDPEILPKLFTKFASKSQNGLGLGLFISKGIIDAHGGKIWAKNNEDGKGATFGFTLPICPRA